MRPCSVAALSTGGHDDADLHHDPNPGGRLRHLAGDVRPGPSAGAREGHRAARLPHGWTIRTTCSSSSSSRPATMPTRRAAGSWSPACSSGSRTGTAPTSSRKSRAEAHARVSRRASRRTVQGSAVGPGTCPHGASLATAPPCAARVHARRVRVPPPRARRGGRDPPVRLRGARPPRRPDALRVPAARPRRSSRSAPTGCAGARTRSSRSRSSLREPAAAIYARAHAGRDPSADDALFRTILLDLLIRVAEACGGFDWDDESFDRAFGDLERSLFGERRAYAAVAPLVGLSTGLQRVLSDGHSREAGRRRGARTALARGEGAPPAGIRQRARPLLRASSTASGSTPARTSRTRRPRSRTSSRRSGSRPRRPWRRARCSSRRSTGGRTASARCCRSPRPSRPASRRSSTSSAAPLAAELLIRLGARRCRHEPRRGARPLGALALPARAVPLRAAARRARRLPRDDLAAPRVDPARDAARGARGAAPRPDAAGRAETAATAPAASAVRRALVEVLRAGERQELVARLDRELLGVPSERPVRVAS